LGNRFLNLDEFTESIVSISKYRRHQFEKKDKAYSKMVDSIKNIMQGELTEKQRTCILMYYGEMMKMKDIANTLGIGVSSVSRHIKKAKLRIKKTMEYYF